MSPEELRKLQDQAVQVFDRLVKMAKAAYGQNYHIPADELDMEWAREPARTRADWIQVAVKVLEACK